MVIFRAPAAVHALLKKRKREKMRKEAVARDFPTSATSQETLMEGSLLYEDRDLPGELFERHVVLTYEHFEISSALDDKKSVPIRRVIKAQANDARRGTLLLRNHQYAWAEGSKGDLVDGSGDLEEVTVRRNAHASSFMVRSRALIADESDVDVCEGPRYTFICSSQDERDQWLEAFQDAVEYYNAQPKPSSLEQVRTKLKALYFSEPLQVTVAGLILANFMCMAAEAQSNPEQDSDAAIAFANMEFFFTCVFCVELALNMFANLFWDFVSSGWNWFDVFVIATAVVSLSGAIDTGGLVHLRLLRAFRVLRFFNRIPSLQKIVVALYASIPAMSNAMALTFMVLAMYSVMAVTFFKDSGEEYFGTFSKALFTLFQFSTGDGWSDIVRAIPVESEADGIGIAVFFVSFMIVVSIVLMQVVIAVLLEEFSKIGNESDTQSRMVAFQFSPNPFAGYMPHLTLTHNEDDLKEMMRMIFRAIVASSAGRGTSAECETNEAVDCARLDFDQLHRGVLALQVKPQCIFTRFHWQTLCEEPGLLEGDGKVGVVEFAAVMRTCLYTYNVSQLNLTLADQHSTRELVSVARALKFLLIRHGPLRATQLERG
eukprot:CAMPEP_0173112316 /NCGR_PEP_ID=MMETSP1102-20130122/45922_1 /TAXON_ID=49646 /ORGANISM="Geminigera sp., Strain Caron Lab Isolate" /LENGTH=600 /DNA_ID=CAMNT_0014013317 /DNA_START=71 /DNA_END=1869 /DNA_ORIENTATION=+